MASKHSGVACPFCGCEVLRAETDGESGLYSVCCTGCAAIGPVAESERDAIAEWNSRTWGEDDVIRIEEQPVPEGFTMALFYQRGPTTSTRELVHVDFVAEEYAATMRGALTLIGGMRKAEVDEDGEENNDGPEN